MPTDCCRLLLWHLTISIIKKLIIACWRGVLKSIFFKRECYRWLIDNNKLAFHGGIHPFLASRPILFYNYHITTWTVLTSMCFWRTHNNKIIRVIITHHYHNNCFKPHTILLLSLRNNSHNKLLLATTPVIIIYLFSSPLSTQEFFLLDESLPKDESISETQQHTHKGTLVLLL